ncbi:glycosyltransferase family 2 protein [Bremerella sp. JC770]|uniref:glycosyltransferase family 2 protein n=1 Tax=Bremerella sp. JC770 TaxID=3232137 RepID=UPI0034574E27
MIQDQAVVENCESGHRLSLIVPCYNQEQLIGDTLESLNAIDPANRGSVEVVVVNDGSQDNSQAVIEEHVGNPTGHTWRVIHQNNGGVSDARNTALAATTGNWIMFLDGDDLLLSDPVPHLKQHPEATCLGFSIERFSSRSRKRMSPPLVQGRQELFDCLTAASPFFTNSLVFRKSCVSEPFDSSLRYLEDWKFWFQNAAIFDSMVFVDQVLSLYRVHEGNRTSDFAKTGVSRRQIAQHILQSSEEYQLTAKQKNNARLQDAIGAVLDGPSNHWKAFFAFPCSPVLMAKFYVYFLLRGNVGVIHPFG